VVLSDGRTVSFDVIVPSLPGFAFSSAPPVNWTIDDTGRVFNTLMVDVMGYKTYAVHGTDWGSGAAYSMYDQFSTHVRASHFAFLPFFPLDVDQLAARNISLSPLEQFEEGGLTTWVTKGQAYFQELSTEPNTIGLALYDNPVGQLAFIGHKIIICKLASRINGVFHMLTGCIGSDPRQGNPPSVVTHNEILRTTSLYYLTHSFVSAGFVYAQNLNGFKTKYTKARTDAPLLFSAFKYNVAFWPPALVATVGNLVSYKSKQTA
jgi:hypothetical protein